MMQPPPIASGLDSAALRERIQAEARALDTERRLFFASVPEGCTLPPDDDLLRFVGVCGGGGGSGRSGVTKDDEHVYQHFFADFGPLHMGHVHAFCQRLAFVVKDCSKDKTRTENGEEVENDALERQYGVGSSSVFGDRRSDVYVCSSDHPHRRSNAAVLVLAFLVLYLGKTAEEAYTPFLGLQPPLAPFRDASFGVCTYHLEVLDCARALARASALGHLDLHPGGFNTEEYAFYDKLENGDLNWIIPGKFLAFSGPLSQRREIEPGKWTLLAEDYVPIFRKLGVTCVIRFNKKCYDRRRFTEAGGIKHVDLFYEDGGNPTEQILQKFLRICEENKGGIAVHCKAGLGRTGTNIALYMMKHYGYTAAESIALCRICRPGSIVGPQQQFLHDLEPRMKNDGEDYRQRLTYSGQKTYVSRAHGAVGSGGGVPSGDYFLGKGGLNGDNDFVGRGLSPSDANRRLSHDQHKPRQQSLTTRQMEETFDDDVTSTETGTRHARRAETFAETGANRRPTTSPLVLRRHSHSYSSPQHNSGTSDLGTAGYRQSFISDTITTSSTTSNAKKTTNVAASSLALSGRYQGGNRWMGANDNRSTRVSTGGDVYLAGRSLPSADGIRRDEEAALQDDNSSDNEFRRWRRGSASNLVGFREGCTGSVTRVNAAPSHIRKQNRDDMLPSDKSRVSLDNRSVHHQHDFDDDRQDIENAQRTGAKRDIARETAGGVGSGQLSPISSMVRNESSSPRPRDSNGGRTSNFGGGRVSSAGGTSHESRGEEGRRLSGNRGYGGIDNGFTSPIRQRGVTPTTRAPKGRGDKSATTVCTARRSFRRRGSSDYDKNDVDSDRTWKRTILTSARARASSKTASSPWSEHHQNERPTTTIGGGTVVLRKEGGTGVAGEGSRLSWRKAYHREGGVADSGEAWRKHKQLSPYLDSVRGN